MIRDPKRRADLERELERELSAEPTVHNPANAEPWMDQALCAQVDPEIFFPEQGNSAATARKICLVCPVLAACDEFAERQTDLYGMLAGKTALERRKAHRKSRLSRAGELEILGDLSA